MRTFSVSSIKNTKSHMRAKFRCRAIAHTVCTV